MNHRRWKHVSAFVGFSGGLCAALGLVSDVAVAVVGGILMALGGYGVHVFGEAAERQRSASPGRRGTPKPVERSDAIVPQTSVKGPDTHGEIDRAFEHVSQGRPDLTIERLQRLKRWHWNRLDARERYRLLANRGNAKLAQQDKGGASADYIRAATFQPDDEDARALEALGHQLLGECERAHEIATRLCDEHPGLGRAHMIRVRTAPPELSVEELEASIPSAVRGHPEVALALHDRAVAAKRLEAAERFLRGCSGHEEWPLLVLALGSTLLQRVLEELRLPSDGPVLSDSKRLREAVRLFTDALEQLPETDPEGRAFGAYLNRGTARRLLGDTNLARQDFLRARELQPADERVAIALAGWVHASEAERDAAISSLSGFLKEQGGLLVELMLAQLLRERGETGDYERATELAEALLPRLREFEEPEQRVGLVETLVDLYLETDRREDALAVVEGLAKDDLSSTTRHALRGNLLWRLGRAEEAVAEAEAARDSLGESTRWSDVRRAARLLESLDLCSEALELWRRIVGPDFVSRETRHLLHCAREAGEHDFLVGFCEQLRAAGHYDHQALACEVETLVHYSEYPRARAAFLDYLEARPDDKVARLNLTMLALQQGWEELVENDRSKLPTLEEVSEQPGIGAQAVDALRAGPDPTLALDYAYDLYRRFPDEAEAHQALVVALLAPGRAGLRIDEPEVAAAGTAVRYREVDEADEGRWLVLEDAADPKVSRDEYSLSHPLAQAVLGKRVDEEFQFPKGFRDRTGVVLEIKDKRVHRAHQLMFGWPDRFPDKPFLEAVPIPAADAGTPDLGEVLKVLGAHSDARKDLERAYGEGKLPISSFARFGRKTVFETMTYLAANREFPVRVCRGRSEDVEEAIGLLDDATSVVLEPTALTSLALLDEVGVLESMPCRCLVTEGTLQELRDLARDDPPHGERGWIDSEGEGLWMHETTEKEEEISRERLQRIIGAVERSCQIIGGGDLARVESEVRHRLTECVAQASAEAAAVASLRDAILWTDDELLHQLLGQLGLEAPRVWTQAAVFWMHGKGRLETWQRSRITVRMLRFGYFFTSLNARVVVDTCEAAAWRTEDPDLSAVLADFGNPGWDFETALQMTKETVSRVWREAPLEEHARSVTGRLLVHLADRTDHRRIMRRLLGQVESLLGLAMTRADGLRDVLRTFLLVGGPSL